METERQTDRFRKTDRERKKVTERGGGGRRETDIDTVRETGTDR